MKTNKAVTIVIDIPVKLFTNDTIGDEVKTKQLQEYQADQISNFITLLEDRGINVSVSAPSSNSASFARPASNNANLAVKDEPGPYEKAYMEQTGGPDRTHRMRLTSRFIGMSREDAAKTLLKEKGLRLSAIENEPEEPIDTSESEETTSNDESEVVYSADSEEEDKDGDVC
jgi:hypothetical protein